MSDDTPKKGRDRGPRPPSPGPSRPAPPGSASGDEEETPRHRERPPEDDPHVNWERHGWLDIAVSRTERWRVADPIAPQEESDQETPSKSGKLLHIPAARRAAAQRKDPPAHNEVVTADPNRIRRAQPLQSTGRAGQAADEWLHRLLLDEPALAPLAMPADSLATGLARLGDADQERWLGLRNGMARTLKIPVPLPRPDTQSILERRRNATRDPVENRALDTALRRLASDPADFWNLVARAYADRIRIERGATLDALRASLPEPAPLTLPSEFALPLIPAVGRWLVDALVVGDTGLDRLEAATQSLKIFPKALRSTLSELAEEAGVTLPPPDQSGAWTEIALGLLRSGLEDPNSLVSHAASRPLEPERHLRIAARLLKNGHGFLAERSMRCALLLHPEHPRGPQALRAIQAQREAHPEVVISHPAGTVCTGPGTESGWRLEPPLPPTETPLTDLQLPPIVLRILADGGLTTREAVESLSDPELLALKGMGPRRLTRLREALGAS